MALKVRYILLKNVENLQMYDTAQIEYRAELYNTVTDEVVNSWSHHEDVSSSKLNGRAGVRMNAGGPLPWDNEDCLDEFIEVMKEKTGEATIEATLMEAPVPPEPETPA